MVYCKKSVGDRYMKEENTIKVIFKRVNKVAKIIEIKNNLETKQKLVDRLIEVVPFIDNVLIICNKECKLLNKKVNLLLDYDFIAGDIIIVGDDIEKVSSDYFSDEQINNIMKDLQKNTIKHKENEIEL